MLLNPQSHFTGFRIKKGTTIIIKRTTREKAPKHGIEDEGLGVVLMQLNAHCVQRERKEEEEEDDQRLCIYSHSESAELRTTMIIIIIVMTTTYTMKTAIK